MITCRDLIELLGDFVGEELAVDRRVEIEQHLVGCPHCVVLVETYRLTIRISRKLPDAPLPPRLSEQLQQLLRHVPEQE